MNPEIASLICAFGIAGLLYLDREKGGRVSMALWVPGLWLAAVGSRPVSAWFGLQPSGNVHLEGSPLDAAFYGILLLTAIVVLIQRKAQTRTLLFANRSILIYFLYCLISVAWSYHPDVSLKRWIKAIGDLAIVLVVLTEEDPVGAIRRIVSRVGFILLPISVLFIKYYQELGRGYNNDGLLMNTGVTTNKNALGLTVLVVSLVVVWNLRSLLANKDEPNRARRLVAQAVLLAFGLVLFWMANCSTCKACFALGSFMMIASSCPVIRRRPARIHVLCLAIVLAAGVTILFGGGGGVIEALGRQSSMSGRTDIWAAVIRAVPNPLIGAGYEGFWLSPSVQIFQQQLLDKGWYPALVRVLNEAHNGYIETYLNLGWIGVFLVATIFLSGYRSSVKTFRLNPDLGSFTLAVIAVAAVYSITEAGFRMLNPAWIFFLLAMVSASGAAVRLFEGRRIGVAPSHDMSEERSCSEPAYPHVSSRRASGVRDKSRRALYTTAIYSNSDGKDRTQYSSDRS